MVIDGFPRAPRFGESVAFISRGEGALERRNGSRGGGSCHVTERAAAFQIPKRGTCVTAGKEPAQPRYLTNHGHQAEVLLPIVDDAVTRGYAPQVVHWGWRRTHWVNALLGALLPFTTVHTARESPAAGCYKNKPVGTGGGHRHWLRNRATSELMRHAVWRHCGLRQRPPSLDKRGR